MKRLLSGILGAIFRRATGKLVRFERRVGEWLNWKFNRLGKKSRKAILITAFFGAFGYYFYVLIGGFVNTRRSDFVRPATIVVPVQPRSSNSLEDLGMLKSSMDSLRRVYKARSDSISANEARVRRGKVKSDY